MVTFTKFTPIFASNRGKDSLCIRLFLLMLFSFFISQSYAQDVLWGLTPAGGPQGGGTAFSMNSNGGEFTVHREFHLAPGNLRGELVQAEDGTLFGTSRTQIFKISADGKHVSTIKTFNNNADAGIINIVLAPDGMLYGTVEREGYYREGKIFRVSRDGSQYEELKVFQEEADGNNPRGKLLLLDDGYLYGSTVLGGALSGGTIFRIQPDGNGFQVLKHFDRINFLEGYGPEGNLIMGTDGYLYGTTKNGGLTFNSGTIFRVRPDGTEFHSLKKFHRPTDGANPVAGLIQAKDGLLYGMNAEGPAPPCDEGLEISCDDHGGTIFQIATDGSNFKVLHLFGEQGDGSSPTGSLIQSSDGNFYGITHQGIESGSIFRISEAEKTYSIIKSVEGVNNGGFIQGQDNKLYGIKNQGIIFTLAADGSDYTEIADIRTLLAGASPYGSLMEHSNGDFYGMTMRGGGHGTVFRLSWDGKTHTVLKIFDLETDGGSPEGDLTEGADGYLYGMTRYGGYYGSGTIFKISPEGENFTVLKNFNYEVEGGSPNGSLLLGSDGYLYGMALQNNGSYGNIFKISPTGNEFTILKQFNGASDGGVPRGTLIQAQDGFLYGATSEGGANGKGTIFKIGMDGTGFFVTQDLEFFVTSLMEGKDGNLYATTSGRSTEDDPFYFDGTILRISPDGNESQIIKYFSGGEDGAHPVSLVQADDGTFFGMTMRGGNSFQGNGVIFKMDSDNHSFKVLREFDRQLEGYGPRGKLLIQSKGKEECPTLIPDAIRLSLYKASVGQKISANTTLGENWLNATWHWGDGETSEATFTDTTALGSHTYTQAGSYSITLVVTDDCGTSTSTPAEVEVTEEAQAGTGSVKGTGMLSSPRGAYVDKPQMKGMAHYSISAQHEDGEVTGSFQFKIADLQFKSTKFNRLLVEDNMAWLHGEGKIKGKGSYGFLIAAVDKGSKEKNLLRVKIWDIGKNNRLVYDNQLGDGDEAVAKQEIDRGTIIILDEEGAESGMEKDLILEQLKKIKAFPNPVQDKVTIDLGSLSPEIINTVVTDAYGKLELHNIHHVNGNLLEFDLSQLKFGFYYIQIRTEHGYRSIKLLKR